MLIVWADVPFTPDRVLVWPLGADSCAFSMAADACCCRSLGEFTAEGSRINELYGEAAACAWKQWVPPGDVGKSGSPPSNNLCQLSIACKQLAAADMQDPPVRCCCLACPLFSSN